MKSLNPHFFLTVSILFGCLMPFRPWVQVEAKVSFANNTTEFRTYNVRFHETEPLAPSTWFSTELPHQLITVEWISSDVQHNYNLLQRLGRIVFSTLLIIWLVFPLVHLRKLVWWMRQYYLKFLLWLTFLFAYGMVFLLLIGPAVGLIFFDGETQLLIQTVALVRLTWLIAFGSFSSGLIGLLTSYRESTTGMN